MSFRKRILLNSGFHIPQVGFGTWQAGPGEAGDAVFQALKTGYRHIDCAKIYGNQAEIGQALKKAFSEIPNLKREDVFITSKLWNTQHSPELVELALDDCLEEIGLDYLDLYLIHCPVSFAKGSKVGEDLLPLTGGNLPDGDVDIDDSISIIDTWKAMTQLPKSKVKSVGVSNHTVAQVDALIQNTNIVPAVLQVERHPLLRGDALVDYCKNKGIHVTAYSDAAKKASTRIGADVTPAQVLIAWAQIGGHSVIPKSISAARIQQNFQEVELSDEEIKQVGSFDVQRRYNVPYVANKPRWDINIYGDESEKTASHQVVI